MVCLPRRFFDGGGRVFGRHANCAIFCSTVLCGTAYVLVAKGLALYMLYSRRQRCRQCYLLAMSLFGFEVALTASALAASATMAVQSNEQGGWRGCSGRLLAWGL